MSSVNKPRELLQAEYEEAAEAYLRSLPFEHFMEATPQATQRKITVESLDLVQVYRPDIQTFNELLVQYPMPGQAKLRPVVPDNMVVVCPEPIQAPGSFDLPLQPARPFLMLEYVSKQSKRKDYEDNFLKYERDLRVPYFLTFFPDIQELTLYRLESDHYVSVKPNDHGRLAIPELELEIAVLDGWARYWFRSELLPLPGDLLRAMDQLRRQLDDEKRRADDEKRRADEQANRADLAENRAVLLEQELAKLRAQLAQLNTPPGS